MLTEKYLATTSKYDIIDFKFEARQKMDILREIQEFYDDSGINLDDLEISRAGSRPLVVSTAYHRKVSFYPS